MAPQLHRGHAVYATNVKNTADPVAKDRQQPNVVYSYWLRLASVE